MLEVAGISDTRSAAFRCLRVARAGLVFLCLCLAGCALRGPDPERDFRLSLNLFPAFHPAAEITAARAGQDVKLRIAYRTSRTEVRLTEEYALEPNAARTLCRQFDKLSHMYQPKQPQPGVDGITVEGSFTPVSGTAFSFDCWSPTHREAPRDAGVVDAVYEVLDSIPCSRTTTEYFEQLSPYFDHGLPVKVFGGDPYRIRFYGTLRTEEEKALKAFMATLPRDKPILVDMSNFGGMSTDLYAHFRRLVQSNPRVRWIAPDGIKKQLLEIGVKETDVESPPASPPTLSLGSEGG